MPDEPIPKMFYRIRGWNDLYENNQTRVQAKPPWMKVKLVVGTDEYHHLVSTDAGAAHFGVWNMLLQIAMNCKPRGSLVRWNNTPHTAESLALLCVRSASEVREAIERLLEVGWLETISYPVQQPAQQLIGAPRVQLQTQRSASEVRHDRADVATSRARERDLEGDKTLHPPDPPSPDGKGGHGNRNGNRKLTRREQQDARILANLKRDQKYHDVK